MFLALCQLLAPEDARMPSVDIFLMPNGENNALITCVPQSGSVVSARKAKEKKKPFFFLQEI